MTETVSRKFLHRALLIFLCLAGYLFFTSFFPFQDTMYYYQTFHIAHGAAAHHGEIPQWLPYSCYGVNADWYFYNCMTVFKYLFIAAGVLFRIENSMALFKAAMLFEQAVFVFGVYILSRRLFKTLTATVFTTVCATGSLVLNCQASLNFYAYYLLPLVLYFILRFFAEKRPSLFLLALIILVLSVPGQAVYFLPIFFMELSAFILVLAFYHRRNAREFFRISRTEGLKTLLFAAVFTVLFSALIYGVFHCMDFLELLTDERDPLTNHSPLGLFLTYGGQTGFSKFIGLLLPETLVTGGYLDQTLFTGILSLCFAVYALAKVRRPELIAVTASALVISLFSLGGWFSTAAYYLIPGMKYVRHIGLSAAVLKLFIPLMAGFGVDRLLSDEADPAKSKHVFCWFILSGLCTGVAVYAFVCKKQPHFIPLTAGYIAALLLVIAYLFIRKNISAALVLAIAVEMLGYQAITHTRFDQWETQTIPPEISRPDRLEYQPRRTIRLTGARAVSVAAFSKDWLSRPFASYTFYYDFIQWDSFEKILLTFFCNRLFLEAVESRGGRGRDYLLHIPANDPFFSLAAGRTKPKLCLVSDVSYAQTHERAVAMLKALPPDSTSTTLTGVPDDLQCSADGVANCGRVDVSGFSYNRLDAEAEVLAPGGAWLYYADAWHPSWKARVNDTPTAIYPANVGFKAIHLPPGKSSVSFVFQPALPIRAAMYTLITAGMCFTTLLGVWMAKRLYLEEKETDKSAVSHPRFQSSKGSA